MNKKNVKVVLLIAALLITSAAFAAEWVTIGPDGRVTQVIVANTAVILDRDDGPWIRTYTKVGIGWQYWVHPSSSTFVPPAVSTSTPGASQ